MAIARPAPQLSDPPEFLVGEPRHWLSAVGAKMSSLSGLIELIVIFGTWEIAISQLGLWNPKFLPPPSDIAAAFLDKLANGSLLRNVAYSFSNFAVGYPAAVVVAVLLGFFLGTSPRARGALAPFLWVAYATPRVALQPILVLWMGFGVAPKILIIFLIAVFPMLFTIMEGARSTDRALLRAGRVFGVRSQRTMFRLIIAPAALPYVITALRIGVARAFVGIVVGEFIGGMAGIGWAIGQAGFVFRLDTAMAYTLVLVFLANVSMASLLALKRRLAPWDNEKVIRMR